MKRDPPSKSINLGRHAKNCKICSHPKCEEIEQDFINWRSPAEIAKTYKLSDRGTVYRHAHAFNLFGRRRRNVRAALERIIEKSGEVEVTAASLVAAVQAYAKINSVGQWIDRNETVNMNELFDRMTDEELETYARDGTLPEWFQQTVTAAPIEGQNQPND